MVLKVWDLLSDRFNHVELAANWDALDAHDHTSGKGTQIPAGGLASNSVTAAKIASDAVTTAKILDANVTGAKLASSSVDGSKIVGGTIDNTKMAASSVVLRTVHSFTIAGGIRVPSGDVDYIPPFRVHKTTTQTVKLVEVSYRLNNGAGGTTATFQLEKNGASMTGFTGITVNSATWNAVTPTAITLADNDQLALVITAIVGLPQNLSVTLVLEHGN
jgi:hypothetical protein